MKDLTKGRPIKLIFFFALPILLGNLFQQTYNLADIIIIGHNLGNNSIAAVGATAPVVSLLFSIINGLVTGFAIVIAENFGAGDHEEMRRSAARTLAFSAAATLVIIVGIAVFIEPLLRALNVSDSIFTEARDYLFIIDLGLVVTLLYNYEAGILRAVGDSVVPLIILIISTFLNIGLDLLLVSVLHMGVVGAAVATVSAQAISAAVCLVYLIKKRPYLVVRPKDFKFTKDSSAKHLAAGFGMALMYSIVDIGSIVLQNGINGFGDDIITAHTAARKLFSFTVMPYSAVCATLVTFCSQNRGAGKYARIRRGILDGLLIMSIWSVTAIILVYTAGEFILGLIVTDTDTARGAAILKTALLYMKWNVPFYFCLEILLGLRSSLQGLGRSLVPILCSIIELSWKIVTVAVMIPLIGGKDRAGAAGATIKEIGGYFAVVISEPVIWTACAAMIGIIAINELRKLPREDNEDIDSQKEKITSGENL